MSRRLTASDAEALIREVITYRAALARIRGSIARGEPITARLPTRRAVTAARVAILGRLARVNDPGYLLAPIIAEHRRMTYWAHPRRSPARPLDPRHTDLRRHLVQHGCIAPLWPCDEGLHARCEAAACTCTCHGRTEWGLTALPWTLHGRA